MGSIYFYYFLASITFFIIQIIKNDLYKKVKKINNNVKDGSIG
jgi:hypothetical protein